MRSFKENKNFESSLVELPRNYMFSKSSSNENLRYGHRRLNDIISHNNITDTSLKKPYQFNINQSENMAGRIEMLQYKVILLQRQQNHPSKKNYPFQELSLVNSPTYNHSQQLHLMKQNMGFDLSSQKEEIRNQNMKVEQLNMRQLQLQQQIREWLNQQKIQTNMKISTQTDQIKGSEMFKQKRFDYQYQNLKSSIANMQSKFEQDIQNRFKLQANSKNFFIKELKQTKEQLNSQFRQQKENMHKCIKDLKDSYYLLKELINKDKQSFKQAIQELQKEHNHSLGALSMKVKNWSNDLNNKEKKIQQKVDQIRNEFTGFKMANSQQLQQYKSIVLNVQDAELQNTQFRYNDNSEGSLHNIDQIIEELNDWKSLTQQKNVNIFREVTNAMKQMKIQSRKDFDSIAKEFQEMKKVLKDYKSQTNKKIEKQKKQLVEVMTEQFDTLLDQIQKLNQLIFVSKNQLDQKLKDAKNEIQHEKHENKEHSKHIQAQIDKIMEQNDVQKKQLSVLVSKSKEVMMKEIGLMIAAEQKKNKEANQILKASNNQIKKNIDSVTKNQQLNFDSQKAQTAKQISKVTQEITSLMNDWTGKLKKERQTGEVGLKQSLQALKKQNGTQIGALKSSLQQKLKEIKNVQSQKKIQDQNKANELKSMIEQSIDKISKTLEEESSKNTKKIDKINQTMNKKQQQNKKKEEDSKLKNLETEKKMADLSVKLKTEINTEIKNNQVAKSTQIKGLIDQSVVKLTKSIEQQSKKRQKLKMQLQQKVQIKLKSKGEQQKAKNIQLDNKLNDLSIKIKTEIVNDIKNKQGTDKQKLNSIKIQLDKKIDISMTTLKKQMEINIASQITKSKKYAQELLQKGKQKQNEIKAKDSQLNKKIYAQITNIKKDISSENSKDKKILSDELNKLNAEFLKHKLDIDSKFKNSNSLAEKNNNEVNLKIDKNKSQIDGRFADLKGVSLNNLKEKDKQSQNVLNKKLQTLKKQIALIFEEKYKLSDIKMNELSKQSKENAANGENLKKMIGKYMETHSKQIKQLINKLQAQLFTQKQKNTVIYSKMSSDIVDMADSLNNLVLDLKPAK